MVIMFSYFQKRFFRLLLNYIDFLHATSHITSSNVYWKQKVRGMRLWIRTSTINYWLVGRVQPICHVIFMFHIVMWVQESRMCIFVILQEKPFYVLISFSIYCFVHFILLMKIKLLWLQTWIKFWIVCF